MIQYLAHLGLRENWCPCEKFQCAVARFYPGCWDESPGHPAFAICSAPSQKHRDFFAVDRGAATGVPGQEDSACLWRSNLALTGLDVLICAKIARNHSKLRQGGFEMNALGRRSASFSVGLALCICCCGASVAVSATSPKDPLGIWYRMSLELVRHTPTYTPPVASRAFAYIGITAY